MIDEHLIAQAQRVVEARERVRRARKALQNAERILSREITYLAQYLVVHEQSPEPTATELNPPHQTVAPRGDDPGDYFY